MATASIPQNAVVLADVESFFDALPAKRRTRRSRAEIYAPSDTKPELENYAPSADPAIVIELDAEAQIQLPVLLFQLGRTRNDVVAQVVTAKIYDLLGLKLE